MKLKGIFLIIFLVLAVVSASFFILSTNRNISANKDANKAQEINSNAGDLVVAPQTPADKVIVDSATLIENGFVVVRQVDDGKVSQIIEMSKPLKAGVNKDITISLGNADVSSKELIVMIYEDYENDGVFNDLDMPALNGEGLTTARFVSTGKPLPPSMTEADMPTMNMLGMKAMVKVRYTDKGFVPNKIEVKAGDMVEFINESSTDMWVASVPHPAHTKLPTFDQFRLYKKGAIYRYIFEKKGTWEYHDHISPSLGGVVVVK
jgi:plastocyanin